MSGFHELASNVEHGHAAVLRDREQEPVIQRDAHMRDGLAVALVVLHVSSEGELERAHHAVGGTSEQHALWRVAHCQLGEDHSCIQRFVHIPVAMGGR